MIKHLKDKLNIITYANGLEFAKHEIISKGSEANIYFTHPDASWEREV